MSRRRIIPDDTREQLARAMRRGELDDVLDVIEEWAEKRDEQRVILAGDDMHPVWDLAEHMAAVIGSEPSTAQVVSACLTYALDRYEQGADLTSYVRGVMQRAAA